MEDYQLFEIIPDGYDWGKSITYFSNTVPPKLAMFNWDQDRSSKKLVIEDD